MDYKKLTVYELAKLISPSSDAYLELQNRGILRTKNVVGELGEYFAIDYYTNHPKLPNLAALLIVKLEITLITVSTVPA